MTAAARPSRTIEPGPPLPFGTILLFILPVLLAGFMHGPEMQMQGLYAKYI